MKLKRHIVYLFALVFVVVGVGLILLPSAQRHSDMEQQNELLELLETITSGAAETEVAPLYTSTPFPLEEYPPLSLSEDVEVLLSYEIYEAAVYEYGAEEIYIPYVPAPEPLDLSVFPQGIVPLGIMTIEAIDLRLPVMEGVQEPELRIAPGRVPETAAIGDIGNAVIAGHRNFTFGSMFNRLGEVENGDIIKFQGLDGVIMEFEVFEIAVLLPTNQIAFIQPQDKAIITLYTCTPIREATHRLIIRAVKI